MIVGLDVHKRETQVVLLPEGKGMPRELRIPTREAAFRQALEGVKGSVAVEAVGFYRPVVAWLRGQGHEVHLANPRLIPKPKVKTDKKDARHLAKLLKADLLPEAWVPSEEIQKLRDLARHRRFLGEEAGRLKSKIKHDLLKHGHFYDKNPADSQRGRRAITLLSIPEVSSCVRLLEATEEEMSIADKTIREEANKREDVRRFMTIPGIAEQTALGIFAEVGDFTRFPDPEKLASYAGLGIRQEQSGDNDKRGHITKEGNSLLLTLLVEAAHNHILNSPDSQITQKYQRKQERDGNTKRAKIAAARTLLHALYAMNRDKTDFKVNPKTPT